MDEVSDHVFVDKWRQPYPIIERGEGVYVYDTTGQRYLDGIGGIHVVSIGHGVVEIANAIVEQARKIAFVNSRQFTNEPQQRLAARIIATAPLGMTRVYFVSGGSEANEIALQIAHQYHVERGHPEKHRVIGRWQSYHGSTVATISMGGHLIHRRRMMPYLLDFPHIQPPHCFHCPFNLTHPNCMLICAKELGRVIEQEKPHTIAAFIAEPIIGTTGGAIVPPPGYYEAIRETCDRYNVLFIADEIITGFGRTGRNFGIEHWEAVPDIMTSSKSLSSGYTPIGAVIVHERIWETLRDGKRNSRSLRLTYSGNPVSCAAALAVQEYISRHNLVKRCAYIGRYLKCKLEKLAERLPMIGSVRGKGLLLAIELVQDRNTRAPFPRSMCLQEKIVQVALEHGLILVGGTGTGTSLDGDHILITPPFVISEDECNELITVLEASLIIAYEKVNGTSHSD